MMKKIAQILNKIFKKKTEYSYPHTFYIVDYSGIAQEMGLKEDINKIIFLYTWFEEGKFYKVRKYSYSEERVVSFRKIRKIPGFDKTIDFPDPKLPIFSTILPMEVDFKK